MAKGRTIWEMLTGKKPPAAKGISFNPLKAKIGSAATLNDIDLKQYDFIVKEMRQYDRTIEGKQFLFTDYVLGAQPLKGDAVLVRLRVNPTGQTDGGAAHNVLVLRLFDEMAYDKGFHDVVSDTTKKIEVTDNNVTQTYLRINDVQTAYKATVSVVRAKEDGKAADEIETAQVEYWDYWRETPDEAGNPTMEFLFVEMDTSTGWFQLWRGEEINEQRVVII